MLNIDIFKVNYHICYFGPNIEDLHNNAINYVKEINKNEPYHSKKMEIIVNSKKIKFQISERHVEIDFEILGVQSYQIFYELFNTIKDSNKKNKIFICLNFDTCRQDLLRLFHTFMIFDNIKFIFVTRNPSFLPKNIHRKCRFISNKKKYSEVLLYNDSHDIICEEISNCITDNSLTSCDKITKLREYIYKLFVQNMNIHDSFYSIIEKLIKSGYINDNDEFLNNILVSSSSIISDYNKNHRALYHFENFLLNIMKLNINN